MAAARDPALVRELAQAVRVEYRALGIHLALHPQADVASEPRWMRTAGTFGQDPHLVAHLVAAYVQGLQGDALGPTSVACMVKHFPGGGPQQDGEDPHFAYGKDQVYPAERFGDHLLPFEAALDAGCAQVMPYYGRPLGLPGIEEVGFGFNRSVITDLLRERLGFKGVVCTDWGILTDHSYLGEKMPAIAWGLEAATPSERLRRAVDAGVDQLGGEDCVELLVDLVENGVIEGERLVESARRLLRQKFELGIVDSPQVEARAADDVVGSPELRAAGRRAQARSVTVITNRGSGPLLPLRRGIEVRLIGIEREELGEFAPVSEHASITLLALEAPHDPRSGGFQRLHRAGRLDYTPDELNAILEHVDERTVVLALLDRPAVMPEIVERAGAVVIYWGGPLAPVLDIVYGVAHPEGRLPFDLPRTMQAVAAHPPDLPGGTVHPVARFGDRASVGPWLNSAREGS